MIFKHDILERDIPIIESDYINIIKANNWLKSNDNDINAIDIILGQNTTEISHRFMISKTHVMAIIDSIDYYLTIDEFKELWQKQNS